MDLYQKQALVDASHMTHGRVTLDGLPAVICGFREPFATIAVIGDTPRSVTFAWTTAQRIFDDFNGSFKS